MNNIVESKRIQYTSSKFAKDSLIYLQEVGFSKSMKQHTSSRNNMPSYLFFVVLEGNGIVTYQGNKYTLNKDNCCFIDCKKAYSHSSSNWQIAWVHFNSNNMSNIYDKYIQRNGKNIYKPNSYTKYTNLITDIYNCANSNDYIKDMTINNKLTDLIYTIMSETVHNENKTKNIYDINTIKQYIDDNYITNLTLDDLSNKFYINKFYLTRLFKEKYGMTINNYINEKRITKSKELLRFKQANIETICQECGINDPNYFSRLFKKIEGITPKEYKNIWNV